MHQDAGIFDLRNCARWAATAAFLPRHYHVLDPGGGQHGVNEAASTVRPWVLCGSEAAYTHRVYKRQSLSFIEVYKALCTRIFFH